MNIKRMYNTINEKICAKVSNDVQNLTLKSVTIEIWRSTLTSVEEEVNEKISRNIWHKFWYKLESY